MRRLSIVVCLAVLLAPHGALAQTPSSPAAEPPAPLVAASPPDERPCDGCPPRRIGRAILQTTLVNVAYVLGNLARGEETAKVTPSAWWKNMRHGWEWDLNDFVTNQFGHPYQGNNYYTSGRANGMNFWESSALAAFGSGTWEYFGETNDASLNDFINTTMGGIALGEMFHRTAWLIRNPTITGRSRLMGEIAATAIDPLTGANRFASGDASRVTARPSDMVPSSLGTVGSVGLLWHGSSDGGFEDANVSPFVEIDLLYGDLLSGRSRTPYDAFGVRLGFGGGKPVSEIRVRGRLLGQPFKDGGVHVAVSQGYQYSNNDAYQFGAQSVELNTGFIKQLSQKVSVAALGWGGVTVLGAADSVAPPAPVTPTTLSSSTDEEATTRDYDYGPGTNAGAVLNFQHGNRTFLSASYELHHIHVIDGIRANHLLQRIRLDLNVPLRGAVGIGVAGDFFARRTFYQAEGVPNSSTHFPQIKAFLTWSVQ